MRTRRRRRTAFGEWVQEQPRGVLSRVHFATGLAYTTVHRAQFKRMRLDVAHALARCTLGAVGVDDIAAPRRTAFGQRAS